MVHEIRSAEYTPPPMHSPEGPIGSRAVNASTVSTEIEGSYGRGPLGLARRVLRRTRAKDVPEHEIGAYVGELTGGLAGRDAFTHLGHSEGSAEFGETLAPPLKIVRKAPGYVGDTFSGEVAHLLLLRRQAKNENNVARRLAIEDRVRGKLDETRAEYGNLPDNVKSGIDRRMKGEKVPENFQKPADTTWCDWIADLPNKQLLEFMDWHTDLLRKAPPRQKVEELKRAYQNYAHSLRRAVADNAIDEAVLQNFMAHDEVTVAVASPFDERMRTLEGYTFGAAGVVVVSALTAHSLRTHYDFWMHELGHLTGSPHSEHIHDHTDEPKAALTEALNDHYTQIITYGNDDFEAGSYTLLRQLTAGIMARAGLKSKEHSAYFARHDFAGLAQVVQARLGYDFLRMMEQTYLERCKAAGDRNVAEAQTKKLMDEVVRCAFSRDLEFDPEVAKIDPALAMHLMGEVRRSRPPVA